jgi:hypothetical protein
MPWGAKYWSKAYVKDPTMAVRECLLRVEEGEALDSEYMPWLLMFRNSRTMSLTA